ncbi:hypothetical protein Poli38472_010795 [Pythium oligandrum]|uniref:FYVE-type domain-containing protein n=1 Tax=Pythium oligandrum TaxID=41045 RepID=A0A8K1CEB7_PYTOL|nr:hypothetical protein Poli38472_010795 [Pythium oligandrum]|eukprot:TMW61732.1 hypothetical protein Poli38472_010795 [Pythium oligandrum]
MRPSTSSTSSRASISSTTSFVPRPSASSFATRASSISFSSSSSSSSLLRQWSPPSEPVELADHIETALQSRSDETVQFVLKRLGPNATVVTTGRGKPRRNGPTYFEDRTLDDIVRRAMTKSTRFCCTEESIASVEEIMGLFVGTDNATLQRNARIKHTKLVETRLLANLKKPTADAPFLSTYVVYTRVRSGMLQRDRDLCAVVSTNCVELSDGTTIGYCLWDSVDLDECPDLTVAQGVIRTRMARSGYVIHNSGQLDATTKIVYLCGLDSDHPVGASRSRRLSVAQHVSSSASLLAMDDIGGSIERICAYFQRKPLDVNLFKPQSDWTPLTQAKYCCSCHYAFAVLSRKYNCWSCGEVMCRRCCRKEVADLPGVGLHTTRICAACSHSLTENFRETRVQAKSSARLTGMPRRTGTIGSESGASTASEDVELLRSTHSNVPSTW